MADKPYIPINCSFYDQLEAWATLKEEVQIEFRDDSGKTENISGLIIDFLVREKVEYLQLKDGKEIRLDHIMRVNGVSLPKSC